MELKQLKKELARIIKEKEAQWKEEVDNNDRKKPIDYVRSATIDGEMNMAMRILTMISD